MRACAQDLKLIGKSEFKELLKWRLALRKRTRERTEATTAAAAADAAGEAGGTSDALAAGDGQGEDDDDSDLDDTGVGAADAELSSAAAAELARRKREAKREKKVRALALKRSQLGMNLNSVDKLDTEDNLFSLTKLRRLARGDARVIDAIRMGEDGGDASSGDGEAEEALAAAGGRVGGRYGRGGGGGSDSDEAERAASAAAHSSSTDILTTLRAREKVDALDDLEDSLEASYAQALARSARVSARSAAVTESGRSSMGIKLSRRERLTREAVVAEAALNQKLDEQHTRCVWSARARTHTYLFPSLPTTFYPRIYPTQCCDHHPQTILIISLPAPTPPPHSGISQCSQARVGGVRTQKMRCSRRRLGQKPP